MGNEAAITKQESNLPAAPTAMELVSNAVQNGASMENVDKLIDLVKFNDEREAVRAFNSAFTKAQAEFPAIKKDKNVSFGNTAYNHASFNGIVKAIRAVLHQNGLSFRHDVKENTNSEGLLASLTVTCVLAHQDGHSESAQLTANPDTSGNKNSIQAVGSAVTYLKRYTLEAVTGVTTTDDDDDAHGATGTVTEEQAANIQSLIDETKSDKQRLLNWINSAGHAAGSVDHIPASMYDSVVNQLESKRGK